MLCPQKEDFMNIEELQTFNVDINQEVDFSNIFASTNSNENIKAESISDGLVLSLSNRGKVDIPYICEICRKDKYEVLQELKGSIFQNPNTWNEKIDQGWETKEEYLSGNLRKKLVEAERADKDYPGVFNDNIEVLQETLNRHPGIPASDIFVTLGSPWLPTDIVEDFIKYLVNAYPVKVSHDLYTGSWGVDAYTYNALNTVTYGTNRMSAIHIIESTLNQTSISVSDSYYDINNKIKRVKNEKETLLVLEKQKLILEKFHQWVFSNDSRKRRLENIYNTLYCTNFARIYDGSFLKFPDLNKDVTLFDYQKNAVARIIFSPNTLLAHDVGSGKTYEIIAAAHELKRMGLSQKNLIVVPNDIVNQWESLYKQMYPHAHILVIRAKDFTPSKKNQTLNKIINDDFDSIIIPYSSFDKIPLSPDFYRKELYKEIENNVTSIKSSQNCRTTAVLRNYRKYHKHGYLEEMEEKIGEREEGVIYFEDLKIDRLFLDECHNYKNASIDTNISALGINVTGSKKCDDMMDKVHYIQMEHNGAGIVFASGTPITNSITDIYNIQRYLQEGELALLKLNNFNSWIANYAEMVDRFEIDVDTSKCRMVRRYADFKNLPELTSLLSNIADFHHIEKDKDLPDFNGYTDVVVPHRPEFIHFLKDISKRADLVRSHKPRLLKEATVLGEKNSYDNMLNITTDGRKAALDIRLVNEKLGFDKRSKVYYCASNVRDLYFKTNDIKGTQLIFCDISTPKDSFNIYDELKSLLSRMGIPNEEIGFIHDATTDNKRNELFKLVNEGKIRVLIGSSFKLATGVNVQNRLVAIHHIDVPWRPSDMVQREGRIIRQGNTNKEIYIYRYICENSFDAYSWQILEAKQIFISRLLNNQLDVRQAEDLDDSVLNYAEVKALAVGDPLIEQRVNTQNRLSRLLLVNSASITKKEKLRQTIAGIENNKSIWQEEIANAKKDLEISLRPENRDFELSDYEKKTFRENLYHAMFSGNDDNERVVTTHRGFKIIVSPKQYDSENLFVYLQGNNKYYIKLGSSPVGYLIRINNFINGLDKHVEELTKRYQSNMEYYEFGKKELAKKDDYQEEIIRLQVQLKKIDDQLKKEEKK